MTRPARRKLGLALRMCASRMWGFQTYSLPKLSYNYGALEPYISGEIMELHHSKHHINHATFWKNLTSKSQGGGEGRLTLEIATEYGSLEKMVAKKADIQVEGQQLRWRAAMVPTAHSQAWDYKGCADVASQVAEDEVRVEKIHFKYCSAKDSLVLDTAKQNFVSNDVEGIVVEDDANISIGKIEHDYVGVLNNDRISFERIAITCPRDGRVASEANDINLVNNLDDKHDVQVVDKFEMSEISRQEAY
ncbi:hypothetical protein L7F22_032454 [Adiantum nelumboides]|nr:hypothetical protein [Adiantum nelumboides]